MALNASMVWRIRTGGSNLNGGGYDAAIATPGTDYTDSDSPRVTFNGTTITATTSGTSTTIAITGYTVAATDIANIVRIASGANFTAGYYVITAVDTGLNTWTLDRNCTSGAGTAMVGRMGGAFASLDIFATAVGAGLSLPTLTSPLAAGHTVMLRGAGSDAPGSNDWDYTAANKYMSFASGNETAGRIQWIGYNGRPRIGVGGLFFYNTDYWHFENLYINIEGANLPTNGVFLGVNAYRNVLFEQNNNDITAIMKCSTVVDVVCQNSGASPSAGTYPAINVSHAVGTTNYGALIAGCFIKNWRGGGITGGYIGKIEQTIITGTKSHGIVVSGGATTWGVSLLNNTLYNNTGDGIRLAAAVDIFGIQILGNILANNGAYGLNCVVGSAALNDRMLRGMVDYNDFYTNTSGARNGLSAGAHDSTLDPQFTNAGGDDFSLGTNLKALGFPGAFRGSSTTSYVDMGAVQRQESSSGSGAKGSGTGIDRRLRRTG